MQDKDNDSGPRSNSTHSSRNTQRGFDSPIPPKWGTPVRGGGSKSENSSGDHFLSKNDDFTRGWTSDSTTWGMLRERTQKGGFWHDAMV